MRIGLSIVMFYVWFTAAANLFELVGIADAMGVSVPGGRSRINSAVNQFNKFSTSSSDWESMIALYTGAKDSALALTDVFTAAPRVLIGFGLPPELVLFLHAPIGLIAGRFMLYTLTGREL